MAVDAIFHRLAAREYRLARDWYATRSQLVGRRFSEACAAAVERIEQMPDSCATLIGEYRYASIRGFPYALVFRRRTAGVVVIVAVAHGRRRPGYWRRRP
jgi:plasmid stabilization system protein ParE